jgi:hypothetical protein
MSRPKSQNPISFEARYVGVSYALCHLESVTDAERADCRVREHIGQQVSWQFSQDLYSKYQRKPEVSALHG